MLLFRCTAIRGVVVVTRAEIGYCTEHSETLPSALRYI